MTSTGARTPGRLSDLDIEVYAACTNGDCSGAAHHDGDGWSCGACGAYWDTHGMDGHYPDEATP